MNTAAKGALLLVFAFVATVTLSTNAYSVGQSCDSGCGTNEYCDYGSYTCQCNSGYADCNGDGTCEDLMTDSQNCNGCGNSCGGNSCCNGVCTDTGSDNYNCGTCGNNCCPFYDPWCWWSAHCTSGICCAMSQTNCGGSCVDTGSDSANCGACGNSCGGNAYCSGGSCYCNMGYTNCGSGCTNTNTDSNNCGGCGTVCGVNQYCSGGICTNNPYCGDGMCDGGENSANCCQDCGNYCGDGTCTSACGESCNSCSMDCGMCPYCGDGTCGNSANEDCSSCPSDCACQGCGMTCDTGQSPPQCRFSNCDGKQCGDNNCGGSCGSCSSGQICDGNGQCQNCQYCNGGAMNCGYDNCGQWCGDPNCMGYCGMTCDSNVCTFHGCDGRVCGGDGCMGSCGSCMGSNTHCNTEGQCECDGGFIDCNGDGNCEVNPNTDISNCGGCNKVCSSNHIIPSCSSGSCTGDCDAGWGDANGDKNTPNGDGCETDLNTEQNCGSIGNVCTQHTLCSNGACTLCELGYGDCNLDAGQLGGDGCETVLTNNNDNCGTCGNKCDTTHFCQGASCAERPMPGGAMPGFEPSLIAMLLAAIAAPVFLMRKY